MSNRHEFTAQTKETLAKRVRYSCSNPICCKSTIGPHSESGKSALVGVAAHITGASPGGPRYNDSLKEDERRSIENGIWLCVNCSTLIDKDESSYSTILLKKWKEDAEEKSLNELIGESKKQSTPQKPFLEADLIWFRGGRKGSNDYALENFKPGEDRIIRAGENYIMYYDLDWQYRFKIVNNSSVAAFNVSVERIEGYSRIKLGSLHRINNIPPYQSLEIKLVLEQYFKGYHFEADKLISMDIPPVMNDVKFKIKYFDEDRNGHLTIIDFSNGEIKQTFY